MARGWGEGGSTRAWRKLRAYVLKRDGYRCQLQLEGCTTRAQHVHHLIPGWQGRPEDASPSALVAACCSCNLKQGDRPADPEPKPWATL